VQVAAYPVIFLLLVLAWLFVISLNRGYQYTFGAFLGWLADKLINFSVGIFGVGGHPLRWLGHRLIEVNNVILKVLGAGIEAIEDGIVVVWGNIIVTIRELGKTIDELAHETGKAIDGLWRAGVVPLVNGAVKPLSSLVHAFPAQIAAIYKEIARLPLLSVKEVRHLIAQADAWTLPRIKVIEHDLSRVGTNLRALTKRLSPAAVVALVGATIFSHFGLGWLRCRGVGKVGRSLCGMTGLIESLFADALDVLLVTHLCQIVTAMEAGARAAEPLFDYLVSMTEGLIKCQGATRPPDLGVEWHEPPTVVNAIAI
jgi:hypothetical protein